MESEGKMVICRSRGCSRLNGRLVGVVGGARVDVMEIPKSFCTYQCT